MRIILLMLCLFPTISFSSSSLQTCQVIAPTYRELEEGINKDTLCSDAGAILSVEKGYIPKTNLLLKVTGRSTYSVSMVYLFSNKNDEIISGSGTEYWFPGDSYFEVD